MTTKKNTRNGPYKRRVPKPPAPPPAPAPLRIPTMRVADLPPVPPLQYGVDFRCAYGRHNVFSMAKVDALTVRHRPEHTIMVCFEGQWSQYKFTDIKSLQAAHSQMVEQWLAWLEAEGVQ